jgi:hypothetical protein
MEFFNKMNKFRKHTLVHGIAVINFHIIIKGKAHILRMHIL